MRTIIYNFIIRCNNLPLGELPFSFSFFIKNSIFNGTVADIVKYSPFCSSLSTPGFSLPSVPLKLGKLLSLSGPHSPIPPSNSTLLLPLFSGGVLGVVVEPPALQTLYCLHHYLGAELNFLHYYYHLVVHLEVALLLRLLMMFLHLLMEY